MRILANLIIDFLRLIFRSKQDIVFENLALRRQLAVQQRSIERPKIDCQLIKLIRTMQNENPTWSPQRIQGELGKLGFSATALALYDDSRLLVTSLQETQSKPTQLLPPWSNPHNKGHGLL